MKESSIAASKQLIWAFTIIFILHNLEELLRMREFLNAHMNELPSFFQQASGMWQGNSFSVAIWGLNGFALLLALLLTVNVQKRWAHVLFVFLAGIMSINAVMHFGQSIFLHNPAPGVVTAVALVLPLSVRSIRHEVSSGWVAKRELWWLLAGGLLAMPLIIWLLMVGSQYLVQI